MHVKHARNADEESDLELERLGAGFQVIRDRKNPFKGKKADAARDDARARLPIEYARKAAAAIGNSAPNHNVLTLAHALAYANAGLHVIDAHALDAQGKRTAPGDQVKTPRGAQWQKRASNDPANILRFWAGDGEYPATKKGDVYPYAAAGAYRNVSITFPDGCGLFVLDIDGDAGLDALAELEAEHGALPRTWESITGSGGVHLIFKSTDIDIRNTASQIAPGVDIRGKNGQIIAPPSVHPSGHFYQWETGCAPWECDVAEAPEWLRKLAYEATKGRGDTPPRKAGKKTKRAASSGSKTDAKGLEAHLEEIGDGDDRRGFDAPIYSAACAYFAREGTDADAAKIKDMLLAVIAAAPCEDDRADERYSTDEYLDNRIKQAREYIEENEPVTLTGDEVTDAAKDLNKDSGDEAIKDYLRDLIEGGADTSTLNRAKDELTLKTALGRRDIAAFIKEIKREIREEGRASACCEGDAIDIRDGFGPTVEATIERLTAANDDDAFLFSYMDQLADVRADDLGGIRIKILNIGGLKEVVSRAVEYETTKAIGDDQLQVSVAPPVDVIENIFHRQSEAFAKRLRGVTNAPFFARDGELIVAEGYHEGPKLFLKLPEGLDIPDISAAPSDKEVQDAVSFLVEEICADFPFAGLTRDEIIAGYGEGDGIPAVAHYLAVILQQFMREMIVGPTPLAVLNKPAPGTGASLAADVSSIITTGETANSTALPRNKEEVAKTLLTLLADGQNIILFDNVPENIDSAELALAITQSPYVGRILGKTESVKVDVRCTWIATANHMTMSSELIRRSILIDMDAKMANPEERSGWRHDDIKQWTRDNRGEIVAACLTIIQNWIAKGRKKDPSAKMGSFENWAGIMGGVLRDAGVLGFLGNVDELREETVDASTDKLTMFMTELATYPAGSVFKAGSSDEAQSLMDILNAGCEASGYKPILMPSWGYSDEAGCYLNAGNIGTKFKAAAKKPHRVLLDGKKVDVSFERETDKKRGGSVYKMSISAVE